MSTYQPIPLLYSGQVGSYFGTEYEALPTDVSPSIREVDELLHARGLTYLGKLTCSQFARVEIYTYASSDFRVAVSVMSTETGLGGIDCVSKFQDGSFLTTTTVQVLHNAYDEQRLFRVSFPQANVRELLERHLAFISEFEQNYGDIQPIFTDLLAIARMVDEYVTRQQSNVGHRWFQFAGGLAQATVAQSMGDRPEEIAEDDDKEYEYDPYAVEYDEEEASPLIRAILQDDLELVQSLLESGAVLNREGWDEEVPLVAAVYRGNPATIQMLIDAGAELNCLDMEVNAQPIGMAIQQERADLVKLLLDAGASPEGGNLEETGLAIAIAKDNLPIFKMLLDAGADPNAGMEDDYRVIMQAALYGHKTTIAALLDAGADPNLKGDEQFEEGNTALMEIASSFFAANRAEVIKLLVERGTDLNVQNDKGETALMLAGNNADAVKALIDAGADLDLRDKDGNTVMMRGNWAIQQLLRQAGASEAGLDNLALVEAARAGDLTKVEELLERGAEVNYCDGSALVGAAGEGHLEVVDRLIQAGADVNLGWKSGWTPIANAAYAGYFQVVECLLAAGANPFQRCHDDEFYDALDYARMGEAEGNYKDRQYAEIIELLSRQPR